MKQTIPLFVTPFMVSACSLLFAPGDEAGKQVDSDPGFDNGGQFSFAGTNAAGNDGVMGLAIDSRQRIIAVGTTQNLGSNNRDVALWRLDDTGRLDPNFGQQATCCKPTPGIIGGNRYTC